MARRARKLREQPAKASKSLERDTEFNGGDFSEPAEPGSLLERVGGSRITVDETQAVVSRPNGRSP